MCALSFSIKSLSQHFSNLWNSDTSSEYFNLINISNCLSSLFKDSFDWTINSCEEILGCLFNFSSLKRKLESDVIKKFWNLNTCCFVGTQNFLYFDCILKQSLCCTNISSDIWFTLSFFERVEPFSQDINNNDIEIFNTKSFVR